LSNAVIVPAELELAFDARVEGGGPVKIARRTERLRRMAPPHKRRARTSVYYFVPSLRVPHGAREKAAGKNRALDAVPGLETSAAACEWLTRTVLSAAANGVLVPALLVRGLKVSFVK